MNIINVVLILGKRLVNNVLTLEGRSRVQALSATLNTLNLDQTAVIFCGGATEGQMQTEAQAMFDCFKSFHQGQMPPHIILEDQSTNTIENICNAADKLVASKLCRVGQVINVLLVSNDYHLNRIFEIQRLMDEQGLLTTLRNQCAQSGLDLAISPILDKHTAVPYPHHNTLGRIFLLLDELTTYRVYLEGVKNQAFARPLEIVREKPYAAARKALEALKDLISDPSDLYSLSTIEKAINKTCVEALPEDLIQQLALLDKHLTKMNRRYDPERQSLIDV
ncbi:MULTISPECIES: YdcF family protein [Vibrio]|uniref:DUF218 domain-containing protein n=1 Tax=Vibrio bivalvicida TaxID=1276888 RepID=A0A177XVV1_9VIBR|nr:MULTISPECIES: YdcF family protein [Vibrio]KLN66535.1 hypothetical protein ZX61_02460 [Vibrio sp. VPAP30]OAJ92720.1 hypothetical protein APB76_18735 [Vibrio bivalvicida]